MIVIVYTIVISFDLFFKIIVNILLQKIYTSQTNIRRVLIVGNNKRSIDFSRLVHQNPQLGFSVSGYVDSDQVQNAEMQYLGDIDMIESLLRLETIDIVAIFLPIRTFYDINKQIISTAEEFGIAVYDMTNIFEPDKAKIRFSSVGSINNII